MTLFTTKKEYMDFFLKELNRERKGSKELENYLNTQSDRLSSLVRGISQTNFWQVFPEILGIDAKLYLLVELLPLNTLSSDEIIQTIENDYQNYFKELCGYNLKTKTKHSMVFNVI